eukprot:jgi/Bigna1/128099/aug1.5_g2807
MQKVKALAISWTITSLISVLALIFMAAVMTRYPPLRKWPSLIIYGRTLASLVLTTCMVYTQIDLISDNIDHNYDYDCNPALAFVTNFSAMMSICLFFSVGINVYVSVTDPFRQTYKKMRGLAYDASFGMCSFPHKDLLSHKPEAWDRFLIIASTLQGAFVLGIVAVSIWLLTISDRKLENKKLLRAVATRVKGIQQAKKYTKCYAAVLSAYILLFILGLIPDKSGNWRLIVDFFMSFVLGLSGVSDLGIWLYTYHQDVQYEIEQERLLPNGSFILSKIDKAEPDISEDLRKEFVVATSEGIGETAISVLPSIGATNKNMRHKSCGGSLQSSNYLGKEQKEIQQQYTKAKASSLEENIQVGLERGERLSGRAHSSIRFPLGSAERKFSVDSFDPKMYRRLSDTSKAKFILGERVRNMVADDEEAPQDYPLEIERLGFHAYKPRIFRRLRETFNISDLEYSYKYKRSFDGDVEQMRRNFSEGKSDSFLYFTADRKFVVKTVTHEEHDLLMDIVDDYAWHMHKHPHSLIIRMFGSYSVRMYDGVAYFCVFNNIFDAPKGYKIHAKFDLKGSTINRSTPPGSSTMKDNDLREGLHVRKETADQILRQLQADSQFLASLNIMDYSLLLGVHYTTYRSDFSDIPAVTRGKSQDINSATETKHGSSGALSKSLPSGRRELKKRPSNISEGTIDENDSASVEANGEDDTLAMGTNDIKMERKRTKRTKRPTRESKAHSAATKVSGIAPTGSEGGDENPLMPSIRPSKSEIEWPESDPTRVLYAQVVRGPAVYHLGIIDILQSWNWGKWVEQKAKVVLKCNAEKELSCVEPRFYQNRFMQFMRERVFPVEAEGMKDFAVRGSGSSIRLRKSRWSMLKV